MEISYPVPPLANYRYYKFTPTKSRGGSIIGYQFSELYIGYNGVRVDYSGATATNPGGTSWFGIYESPTQAIDNNTNTKFYNGGELSPLVIDFNKNTIMNEYTFATANDVADRDPVSWSFHGSNDQNIWIKLDTRTGYPTTTTRNRYLPYFSVHPGPWIPSKKTITRFSRF